MSLYVKRYREIQNVSLFDELKKALRSSKGSNYDINEAKESVLKLVSGRLNLIASDFIEHYLEQDSIDLATENIKKGKK